MKKMTILAVLLCMALALTACTAQDIGKYYQTAQLYLGCGDYAYAAELFAQLGEYEEAADYALYCRALQAIGEGDYALARANLTAVNPFKSSARYLMYIDALEAENEGELETALSLYEKLGSFMEANLAAERLAAAIPEAAIQEGRSLMSQGEYEAAREIFLSLNGYGSSQLLADNCTAALQRAAYNEADKLAEDGQWLEAMAAFTALGDSLDAAERAAECLAAIHADLDARYAAVTLETAPALLKDYAALGEDATAQTRIAELTERYGKNLELITMDYPCVAFGQYPGAESGQEQPVRWWVIRKEGLTLTLLSTAALDASDTAQTVELLFSDAEQAAAGEVTLPSVADLAALTDLRCTATAYALAQGAPAENGAALYWLRDSLENGMHPVISAAGTLMLPEDGAVYGLRPMLTISLETFTFTSGSGTAEDPFRVE